jgi:hypothetical protein
MGFQLSEKQKAALEALNSGPGLMPIIHFGKLSAAGLVKKVEGGSGQRGYSYAELTTNGRAAIAA